jgi:hypothetical protein
MKRDPLLWQRLADAARRSGDPGRDARERQESEPIPWLPGLTERVHASFLKLIWKRWVALAIVLSAMVLGLLYLAQRSQEATDATPPSVPRIPVPSVP